jgi:hypothetical protein
MMKTKTIDLNKQSRAALHLSPFERLTYVRINKQYRLLALRCHPDKQGTNEQFHAIHSAYEYLKERVKEKGKDEEEGREDEGREEEGEGNEEKGEKEPFTFTFSALLFHFIRSCFNKSVAKLVTQLITSTESLGILLDGIDNDTLINIYSFLTIHYKTMGLSSEAMQRILDAIVAKHEKIQVFHLNPSIHDILNNHVYKLTTNSGEVLLVPLWIQESTFVSSCFEEVLVFCIPSLPDSMFIDETNQLNVNVRFPLDSLVNLTFADSTISIPICAHMAPFVIPCNQLKMQREQTFTLAKCGIAMTSDLNSSIQRHDILVHISFNKSFN